MSSENQQANSKAGFSGEEAQGFLGLVACGGMPGSMSKSPLLSGASQWSLSWSWSFPVLSLPGVTLQCHTEAHLWSKSSTGARLSGKDDCQHKSLLCAASCTVAMPAKNSVVTHKVVLAVGFQTRRGARVFSWPVEVLCALSETKVTYWGFLHYWAFSKVSKFESWLNSCLLWKYPAQLVHLEFYLELFTHN